MNLSFLLQHGALYGAILSVLMCLIFIGLAYLNPEIWLADYPPDIRERFGPMSAKARRQRWIAGIPVLLILCGTVVIATVRLAQTAAGEPSFGAIFLSTLITLSIFNLVDLLILDWLIFIAIQPRIIVLPGTEGMAGYRDYGFHFHAFLKGIAGSLIVSLIVAGATVLVLSIT